MAVFDSWTVPTVYISKFVFAGRSGGRGRSRNPLWQASLFLLSGPEVEVLPSTSTLAELSKHGLGKCELEAKRSLILCLASHTSINL